MGWLQWNSQSQHAHLEGYDKSFPQGAAGLQHRLSSAPGRSQADLWVCWWSCRQITSTFTSWIAQGVWIQRGQALGGAVLPGVGCISSPESIEWKILHFSPGKQINVESRCERKPKTPFIPFPIVLGKSSGPCTANAHLGAGKRGRACVWLSPSWVAMCHPEYGIKCQTKQSQRVAALVASVLTAWKCAKINLQEKLPKVWLLGKAFVAGTDKTPSLNNTGRDYSWIYIKNSNSEKDAYINKSKINFHFKNKFGLKN